MTFTFTKTVNGRKYQYQRISTTRVGEKVITRDKSMGPVDPVKRGKIEQAPQSAQTKLMHAYQTTATLPEMVGWFKDDTGITVSGRTISNYMTRHGIKRGFIAAIDMSEFQQRVHAQKRLAKTKAEKLAVGHLEVLLADGAIKPADVLKLTEGIDVPAIEAIWSKHIRTAKKKIS